MDLSHTNVSSNDSPDPDDGGKEHNLVLDNIMKLKERRLKILDQFNKEHEDEIISFWKDIPEKERKKKTPFKVKNKSNSSDSTPSRRSERIKTQGEGSKSYELNGRLSGCKFIERPENSYGPMPGIEVGHHWNTRMECSHDGVHRPTVAGIHPGPEGAYSIALSGGYPEDIDEGHTVIFTGAGGRDLKGTTAKPKNLRTAPQTRDQELNVSNLSLIKSLESKKPIRVIRGYKLDSFFAPETGYRYDGLYKVVQYSYTTGLSGFRVYRFRMIRLEKQAPPPWEVPAGNSRENFNNTKEMKQINIVDNKSEGEIDQEIEYCVQKMCQTSTYTPVPNDTKEEEARNSSFHGWDMT